MTKYTNVVIFLVVYCPSANITSHRTVDSRSASVYSSTVIYWLLYTVSSRMHLYCNCHSHTIMQRHSWKFSLPSMYISPFLLSV